MHIPTPAVSSLDLGFLHVRIYALCIVLGAVFAVIVAIWRAKQLRKTDCAVEVCTQNIIDVALISLPAAIVGARLYYVITVPAHYIEYPLDVFAIWQGGLGIMGGLVFGVAAAVVACQKLKINLAHFAYCAVPPIPLAQAIGRLGNWFNGELYGYQTDLPWGLDLSRGQYTAQFFYHPTFLYEILWNLVVFAVLLVLFNRRFYNKLLVIPTYLVLYTAGRIVVENFRIDTSEYFLGLRINMWCAGGLLIFGIIWIGLIACKKFSLNCEI
ncbi:prolipoprotein diacylglyceryl transferase [Actinomycetota bacterium]|nr:prolipoprotein diacylglyceryl transferase [Actinomycetota bacterium]